MIPRPHPYSESRFTNWARFDPFTSELRTLPKNLPPAFQVEMGSQIVPIFAWPARPGFERPFSAEDVYSVMVSVPQEFLVGLEGVYLLGGTERQRRARRERYGTYLVGKILLHPLPTHLLAQYWRTLPKPSIAMQYTRFGAAFERDARGWTLRFDSRSLRAFYLYDVLLHEIGHHVERHVRPRSSKESERYATWFAEYQAAELLRS